MTSNVTKPSSSILHAGHLDHQPEDHCCPKICKHDDHDDDHDDGEDDDDLHHHDHVAENDHDDDNADNDEEMNRWVADERLR